MRIRHTLLSLLIALPLVVRAQDKQPALLTPDVKESPLPPGAIMRLGETRLRPGVRITHLAFASDGKQLASWGNWMYFEDRLSVWDVATGKELRSVAVGEHQIESLSWGTSGRSFAVMRGRNTQNAVASGLDAFRIWSFTNAADKPPPAPNVAEAGKIMAKKVNAGDAVAPTSEAYEHFALASDASRFVAFRSGGGASTGSVDLFDASACTSGKQLKRVATCGKLPAGRCSGLQFIRGGKLVAVFVDIPDKAEQMAVIWDPAKDTLSTPITIAHGVRQGSRQAFDVADDGSALTVGLADGRILVVELPSGKERLLLQKHGNSKQKGHWPEVCAVKFVNDGRNVLSAGRDGRQMVWNAKTGELVAALDGHESWVEAVAVSPDGALVATAGQDSLIRLWDARTWRPVLPPQGPRETVWRVEVSRDGKYAAAHSGDGVHGWDIASGRELRSLPGGRGAEMLFAPTGELLASTPEGPLGLYSLAGGAGGALKQLKVAGRLLDFTPDGKGLLTGEGNTVTVWDWPAGTKRTTIALGGTPISAAVAPDGKTAVVRFDKGDAASLVDLMAGEVVGEIPCKLHWFRRASGFALGGRVVCGTVGTSRAEMWDVAGRSRVLQFEEPPRKGGTSFYILSFAVSADGRRSASCQRDGGVTVYETATGQIIAHFDGHRNEAVAVNISAEGDYVLSGGGDHSVLVWDASMKRLGGGAGPLPAADRAKAWDALGTQPAKEAVKTMAAFAADADGTVALFASKLLPVHAVEPATLDRIFRDLDDDDSAVRGKASDALRALGEGAIGGVRVRLANAKSAEVRRRADQFLSQFTAGAVLTPDRLRVERAMEVLAVVNTDAARKLIESLARGAAGSWITEAAQRTQSRMIPH